MNETLFAQLSNLGSSLVLVFGMVLLWRRSLRAYINAFRWQSVMLTAVYTIVGYFSNDLELYAVAAVLFLLKAVVIPHYLKRLQDRVGSGREVTPYLNVASSLIVSGLLVLLAYLISRPLLLTNDLPTRGGVPLSLGLIFIGLLVMATRKKALTQIVGFLVLENGIALLSVLSTFGIPLIVEMGVFLDLLMGFLVMQVFVYQIQGTFNSIDVDQLNELKH